MENTNVQRTLAMIKPDAMRKRVAGRILDIIEREGFDIIAMKLLHLKPEQARRFYAVHKDKPFYEELVEYVTSGKIIVMTLEGENAIPRWRSVMGETDPAKADEGTIRKMFGTSLTANACHGSDSPENAEIEIRILFDDDEFV